MVRGFLNQFSQSVIVISHDRAFVDNITNRTIEDTMGRIYDYKASYFYLLTIKEKIERAYLQKAYDEQQKMIAEKHRVYRAF